MKWIAQPLYLKFCQKVGMDSGVSGAEYKGKKKNSNKHPYSVKKL